MKNLTFSGFVGPIASWKMGRCLREYLTLSKMFPQILVLATCAVSRTIASAISSFVTRSPTDAWTAQQRRFATAFGVGPKYLVRDNDGKFGVGFARVAQTSNIEILKTPYYAPLANAICEQFLGSVRRECLDHLFNLHEKQLHRLLNAYMHYFNRAWSSVKR